MSKFQDYIKLAGNEKIGPGEFLEYIITSVYMSILRPGDTVIDGGAHSGRHTFPLSRLVGEKGLVLAFEPLPHLAQYLNTKVKELNLENTKIISKALAKEIGETQFTYVVDDPGLSGIKERVGIPQNFKKNIKIINVQKTTIDYEVFENFHIEKPIRFIKLDLEGGEFHALQGAKKTLKNHEPLIIFESGREDAAKVYEYDKTSFFDFFHKYGYKLADIFGRTFTINEWHAADVPWYFIAYKRQEDETFIENNVQEFADFFFNLCLKFVKL